MIRYVFTRDRTRKDISSFKELAEIFTISHSAVGIRCQVKTTPVHRQAMQSKDRDPRPSPSFSRPLREPARCYLCDKKLSHL